MEHAWLGDPDRDEIEHFPPDMFKGFEDSFHPCLTDFSTEEFIMIDGISFQKLRERVYPECVSPHDHGSWRGHSHTVNDDTTSLHTAVSDDLAALNTIEAAALLESKESWDELEPYFRQRLLSKLRGSVGGMGQWNRGVKAAERSKRRGPASSCQPRPQTSGARD